MEKPTGTRINKYLSEIGYCSRREADKLIEAGRVLVNGKKAEMGVKISPQDKVTVNGEMLNRPKNKKYIWLLTNPKALFAPQIPKLKKTTSSIL